MKELQEALAILEERKPGLTYVEKRVKGIIDRLTVELHGSDSSVFSRLAARYERLDKAIKKMGEKKNELNEQLKTRVEELFAAEDVVLTRVIETASFTLTLSKKQKQDPKKLVNYESIAAELVKLVPEELEAKVNEIYEAYTQIIPQEDKSPALRVKGKLEEGVLDMLATAIKTVKGLLKKMLTWGAKYDKKLAALKADAGVA